MNDPTFDDFLTLAERLLDDLGRAEPRERFVSLQQELHDALSRVRAARQTMLQLYRRQEGVREAVKAALQAEREDATADIRAFAAASGRWAEASAEMASAAEALADAMERARAALRERTR